MVHPLQGKRQLQGMQYSGQDYQAKPKTGRLAETRRGQALAQDGITNLLGRCGWSWTLGRCGLGLNGLGFEPLKYGTGAAALTGVHRQCDRRNHEGDSGPRSRAGEGTGRAARTESGLTALPAESRGDVAALSALQQNHNDDEEANQNVNRYD